MPVAIRKRSWEEHVTHASGLQYSYDDLDLVCCHGVDSEGPWMGAGTFKQGRRTRCASMPESCQALPIEDLVQTLEGAASVVNHNTESEQLKLIDSDVKVPLDLHAESVHGSHKLVDVNIPQRASESEHLQIGKSGARHCNSNSGMPQENISSSIDCSGHNERTVNGEDGAESDQSHNISSDDNAFKSAHISREVQQCTSISSNNGPSLSGSAGERPGKHPNNQETKESHTEGYSRPPEISEAMLNQSSAAELEPPTDLPDVEEEKISTSGHFHASETLPANMLHSSVNMTESGDVMSQAKKTVEPVMTVVGEKGDKEETESQSTDSADQLDGLNDPEKTIENTGLHSRDVQGGEHADCTGVFDQAHSCEMSYHTLLEMHNVEITMTNGPHGEQSAQAEGSQKAAEIRYEPITSSDICFNSQCCSMTVNSNVSSEKLSSAYSEGNSIQTNITQCADQYVETTASKSQPMENTDGSSTSERLACYDDQTMDQELEIGSKLDTILEVSQTELDDTPVLDPQKTVASDFIQSPHFQQTHMDDEYEVTEKHTQNQPLCPAEVNDELSPQGLHGNQASGCYLGESPAPEVADGQREHHRPGAIVSTMEEPNLAANTVIYRDTQLAGPVSCGTNESTSQKEDNVVKVRMRKCEHARLDSMVLLLMKLDQLDQEIENALSSTSSMDSTPTLHRRQLLESELGSVPAASPNPPHPHTPAASTTGATSALGAKPKSGVSQRCIIYYQFA